MAVLLGLFDSDKYNWRSMTSPRITGLFNSNCLQSGADNLMKCYPGDNTYSGAPLTDVSLINPDNQFHSVTTTVLVNGKDSDKVLGWELSVPLAQSQGHAQTEPWGSSPCSNRVTRFDQPKLVTASPDHAQSQYGCRSVSRCALMDKGDPGVAPSSTPLPLLSCIVPFIQAMLGRR